MNQKIHIILWGIILLLSSDLFGNNGFKYKIKGNIRGLHNDSIILIIRSHDKNGNAKADTIISVAKNDQFSIKGTSPGVRDVYAVVGGLRSRKNFTFFIEKGFLQIDGDIDSLDKISITGTPGNNDYTVHKKIENDIYERIKLLQLQEKQIKHKDGSDKVSTEINALRDSIRSGRIHFIQTHPDSPASAIYLYVLQDNISTDQLESLYNRFSQQVKNTSFVFKIPEKIQARKRSAIGKTAPGFISMDTSGKSISLSAFRGKYVLLDFWASWCVPCREENPYLVEAYKKYKDKGFTIIGISMDHIGEKWKEAIQKDQLNWTHLSDLNAFDNKVAKLYGVQPIPDNFLIAPDGKIIARQLRGGEIEDKLNEVIK